MTHHLPLTLIIFFLFITIPKTSSSLFTDSDSPTCYEILNQFGLPAGLLPDTITSYCLSDDRSFIVDLPKPCYIKFEYLVYYSKQITGKLSHGTISNLKGIEVQRFFLWLDVSEIKVKSQESDSIYFQVGLISKKLQIAQFKNARSCRASGVCSGSSGQIRDDKINLLVDR